MDPITLLITFAIIMWLLQSILGWLQIRAFNQAFLEISKKGKITVGRNSGRFNPKSVIVLAFNEEKKVVDSLHMKGFSVFARPQKLVDVIGLPLDQIIPKKIFPTDKRSQFALKVAISSGYSC